MPRSQQVLAVALVLVALGAALAIGIALRVADANNPVMAAEDPYTHMALVREHLRDGNLESQQEDGALYPPGLHAFVATWWAYSGADLYDIMRLGPVVLGVVAMAGVALLLYRWEGALAAFGGVLAFAAMPEAVFRTTMMSPTALDLALLPFLFAALLEVSRGRLAWLAAAVPLAGFLVVAHPWILALVAIGGFLFLVLYVVFPWRAGRGPPVTRHGAAAAVGVLGGALGLALATRWEASGTGFSELTLPLTGYSAGLLSAIALVIAAMVVVALVFLPRLVRGRLPRLNRRPRPTALQVLGVVAMAALLAGITWPAVQHGMPQFVDLPRMLGWPVLVLAAVAILALPVTSSPAAHAAAAMFLATFPFAIHNPLDSPYWPHRTVVFVAFAAAILVGVAAQRIAEAVGAAHGAVRGRTHPAGGARARSLGRSSAAALTLAAVLPALVVGSAVGAVVIAETPGPYAGGWYRYFSECEFEALREVADLANQDLQTLVITGGWQSQLVIAAFTDDATRVWFKPDFFVPGQEDEALLRSRLNAGGPTYVVVDRYLREESPGADPAFLQAAPWMPLDASCPSPGGQAKVHTYQLRQG